MTEKNLPFLLQTSLELVPQFVHSIRKARPGCVRAMRPERQESFTKFLPVLLLGVSLQHDGAICIINGSTVRPMTVEDMARKAGLNTANIERMLADLKDMGYIVSDQIKRKNRVNGQLEVSPGLRFFTAKFWEDLGLKSLFEKSVLWAKKHCKRYLTMPFKIVKLAEKKAKQIGGFMVEVLKKMHMAAEREKAENQEICEGNERGKFWSNEILTMLRQKK